MDTGEERLDKASRNWHWRGNLEYSEEMRTKGMMETRVGDVGAAGVQSGGDDGGEPWGWREW